MKNIQVEKLSDSYTIRRLTDADVPMLYAAQERGIVLLAERCLA